MNVGFSPAGYPLSMVSLSFQCMLTLFSEMPGSTVDAFVEVIKKSIASGGTLQRAYDDTSLLSTTSPILAQEMTYRQLLKVQKGQLRCKEVAFGSSALIRRARSGTVW